MSRKKAADLADSSKIIIMVEPNANTWSNEREKVQCRLLASNVRPTIHSFRQYQQSRTTVHLNKAYVGKRFRLFLNFLFEIGIYWLRYWLLLPLLLIPIWRDIYSDLCHAIRFNYNLIFAGTKHVRKIAEKFHIVGMRFVCTLFLRAQTSCEQRRVWRMDCTAVLQRQYETVVADTRNGMFCDSVLVAWCT